MKDTIEFKNNKCHNCEQVGFFIETPSGANYVICPMCKGDIDYMLYDKNNIDEPYHKSETLNNFLDDTLDHYCNDCGIVFGFSHQHAINGCTDDIFHSLLITKYEIIENSEKVVYDKMPIFDSYDEILYLLKNKKIKFLKYNCTCNNVNWCPNSYYKKNKIIDDTKNCKLSIQYKPNQV